MFLTFTWVAIDVGLTAVVVVVVTSPLDDCLVEREESPEWASAGTTRNVIMIEVSMLMFVEYLEGRVSECG